MGVSLRLRDLLKEKGLTQKQLAEAIGVATSTVNNWVGKLERDIPADYIIPICGFLGVSAQQLLNGDEAPGVSGLSGQEVALLGLFRDLPDDAHRDMVFKQVRAAVDALSATCSCEAPERGEKKDESHASSRGKAI